MKMGELADAEASGMMCEDCAYWIPGKPPGYRRKCYTCKKRAEKAKEGEAK